MLVFMPPSPPPPIRRASSSASLVANEQQPPPKENKVDKEGRKRAMETIAALSAIVGQKPAQQCRENDQKEMDAMVVFLELGLGSDHGKQQRQQKSSTKQIPMSSKSQQQQQQQQQQHRTAKSLVEHHPRAKTKQQLQQQQQQQQRQSLPPPSTTATTTTTAIRKSSSPSKKYSESMVVCLELDHQRTNNSSTSTSNQKLLENPIVRNNHSYPPSLPSPSLPTMEEVRRGGKSKLYNPFYKLGRSFSKKGGSNPQEDPQDSPPKPPKKKLPLVQQQQVQPKKVLPSSSRRSTTPAVAAVAAKVLPLPQKQGSRRRSSSRRSQQRKVRFHDMVMVVEIPSYRDMDPEVLNSIYSSSRETHQNTIRNTIEYNWVGRDWTKVLEEDQMILDPISGDYIHPATWELMEFERQQQERELELLRMAAREEYYDSRQRLWVESKKKSWDRRQ